MLDPFEHGEKRKRCRMTGADLDSEAQAAAELTSAAGVGSELLSPDDDGGSVFDHFHGHCFYAAGKCRCRQAVERWPRAAPAGIEEYRVEDRRLCVSLIGVATKLDRPVATCAFGWDSTGDCLIEAAENQIRQHEPDHMARGHRPRPLGVEDAARGRRDAKRRERAGVVRDLGSD